ncbi:hypothetical protein F5B20DRAFT_588935 [Whalleya microplaca]|nr:hypothetical protein F5B20DRAFT_588935 [Whalleya microplaca]
MSRPIISAPFVSAPFRPVPFRPAPGITAPFPSVSFMSARGNVERWLSTVGEGAGPNYNDVFVQCEAFDFGEKTIKSETHEALKILIHGRKPDAETSRADVSKGVTNIFKIGLEVHLYFDSKEERIPEPHELFERVYEKMELAEEVADGAKYLEMLVQAYLNAYKAAKRQHTLKGTGMDVQTDEDTEELILVIREWRSWTHRSDWMIEAMRRTYHKEED